MFGVGRALRAPVDLTRRAVQLLDDVAALADRARRDPDPLEEALERIDAALVEMRAGIAVLVELLAQTRELTHTTRSLERLAGEMTPRADAMTAVGERLEASAREVLQAEQALVECSRQVEARTGALLADGRRLAAISERIDTSLGAFRTALPRLLEGLDTVEQLEGAVETVADTVEPLQGAAERVGRATQRLSRKRS
jgi:DNA repair ATPase RecN